MRDAISHEQILNTVEHFDVHNNEDVELLKKVALQLITVECNYSYLIDVFLKLVEDQAFKTSCSSRKKEQLESISRLIADMISGDLPVSIQVDFPLKEVQLRLIADRIRGING